ncbi:NUDIX hydrolase [Pseudonocardiaceae bacterium YIM PH 21723]|nr:NUDIX hydrolase [Pseudonocardiaceae bacterium YIM PH 21723]
MTELPELPNNLVLPANFLVGNGDGPPAKPKDAATVALLRDGTDGLEVFLQHRVTGMAFAGGMTVFPGGGVDKRDADTSIGWTGPQPEWWGSRFGCSPELARSLVCAAVRETFEESGVLLAGPDPDSVVADTAEYAEARAQLESKEISFAQFMAETGLVLRADLLRPWSNWVTPAQEPRRYDTRFFVAALPAGQRADGNTSEASGAGWQRPVDAIADGEQGRRMLMPPTWLTLIQIGKHETVAGAVAMDRDIDQILPKIVRDGDQLRVEIPHD